MTAVPVPGRQKQNDIKFKTCLGYIPRPCLEMEFKIFAGRWCCTPLIPALRRLGQVDGGEFEASLIYKS